MIDSINNLKQQIVQLEKLIAKKQEQEKLASHLTPQQKAIATELHEIMCHSNHTDACGWYYDNGNWSEYSRTRYIELAQKLLLLYDKKTILTILSVIKDNK